MPTFTRQPFADDVDGLIEKYDDVRFEHAVTLSFQRAGTISERLVQEGDAVEAGQLLATLDSRVAAAEAAIARERAAMVESVQAAEKAAEAAALEYATVLKGNTETRQTWPRIELDRRRVASESATIEVALQQRQLKIARLEAQLAEAQLETCFLRAPFSGVVTRFHADVGETTDSGRFVVELVDPRTLIVDAYFRAGRIGPLHPGDPVDLVLDSPAGTGQQLWRGQVTFVDLSVQTLRNAVRVSARIPNPDGILRAGVRGHLQLVPADQPGNEVQTTNFAGHPQKNQSWQQPPAPDDRRSRN